MRPPLTTITPGKIRRAWRSIIRPQCRESVLILGHMRAGSRNGHNFISLPTIPPRFKQIALRDRTARGDGENPPWESAAAPRWRGIETPPAREIFPGARHPPPAQLAQWCDASLAPLGMWIRSTISCTSLGGSPPKGLTRNATAKLSSMPTNPIPSVEIPKSNCSFVPPRN